MTNPAHLEPWERCVSCIVGLGALAVAALSWSCPPVRTAFAPGCDAAGAECTARVAADPTAVVVLLVATGAAFLLLAVVGRRPLSIAVPGGGSVTFADDAHVKKRLAAANAQKDPGEAGPPPEETVPPAGAGETVRIDGVDMKRYPMDVWPTRVIADLREHLVKEGEGNAIRELSDIAFAARGERTNSAWFIELRSTGTLWRVAYGGQGKTGASIRKAEPPEST